MTRPMDTPQPFGRAQRGVRALPGLTGLRGLGALWVFAHHWNLFCYGTGGGFHPLAVGYLGVDLFFILSGFIMTHSKYDVFTDISAYTRYLVERVVRLYPTNMAVLALFVVGTVLVPRVVEVSPGAYTPAKLLASALLLQSWFPKTLGGWIAPGWSVSSEMAAYIALPIVIAVVRRMRARMAITLPLVLLVAFTTLVLGTGEHDPNLQARGGFIRLGCEFLAGAGLYQAWQSGTRIPVVIGSCLTALLLAAAMTVTLRPAAFLALPAFGALVMLGAQGQGLVCRVLESAWLQFLGRISYSLYLLHWPVLVFWRAAGGLQAGLMPTLLMMTATLCLAWILHRTVEAPSHQLARRLGRMRPAHALPAIP